MAKKKKHNDHDKYVRESFSDPQRAAALLEAILPNKLVQHLNIPSLQVLKESYIDVGLNEYFSDLVFEVALKNFENKSLDIAFLFEHKSVPDKNVLI